MVTEKLSVAVYRPPFAFFFVSVLFVARMFAKHDVTSTSEFQY